MLDDLVVARTFNSRPEADLAWSALDVAGIDAMVRADSGGDMRPAMAWAGDGFQVIVRARRSGGGPGDPRSAGETAAAIAVTGGRITDYDAVADRFDVRYGRYSYGGVRETVLGFLGDASAVLEVGCGTGHWLAEVAAAAGRHPLAGIDPSMPMLERARRAAPGAHLVRARAEELPWRGQTFDRIFCVNALHHFADRDRFFAEARRVLKPDGGVLTIGKDPHREGDTWWVYDYFEETRAIDRARYAPVRTLRGEMTRAGFAWAESLEADHLEATVPAGAALAEGADGVVTPSFTSQLTVLSEEEFARGVEKMRQADAAAGGALQLVTDFKLYATIGWVR
jgi:SAM-dependent methyltransferase